MTQHQNIYISHSVVVKNRSLFKDGALTFAAPGDDKDFLVPAFEALKMDYPKFYKMDALCKLGILATDVLLKNTGIEQYKSGEVGIVLSNAYGSIEADINYFESSKTFPSPSLFVYTLPNIVIGEISIRYGFKAENAFFISEQFDPDWTRFYVNDLIANHGVKACICGWAEVVNLDYNACVFLVETGKDNGINFTPENLVKYFNN